MSGTTSYANYRTTLYNATDISRCCRCWHLALAVWDNDLTSSLCSLLKGCYCEASPRTYAWGGCFYFVASSFLAAFLEEFYFDVPYSLDSFLFPSTNSHAVSLKKDFILKSFNTKKKYGSIPSDVLTPDNLLLSHVYFCVAGWFLLSPTNVFSSLCLYCLYLSTCHLPFTFFSFWLFYSRWSVLHLTQTSSSLMIVHKHTTWH